MASTTSQAALNVVSKRVMRSTGIRGAEAQRAMVSYDGFLLVPREGMFECTSALPSTWIFSLSYLIDMNQVLVALGIGLLMVGANEVGGVLRHWKSENGFRGDGEEILEKDTTDGISPQHDQLQTTMFARAPSHPPLWLTVLAVLAYHMEYVLSFMFVGLVEPITYGTCDALRRLLIIVAGRQLFGGDRFSTVNMGGIGMALLGALMYSITSAKGFGGLAKKV